MSPPSLSSLCRSLALSTCLLSLSFVHLLCLDFTVAEREEWYTAFLNVSYSAPPTWEWRSEKSECGRYGEHSPKREARGLLVPSPPADRLGCDPASRYPAPPQGAPWVALVARGNCSYRDKIRHAANQNATAVIVYNMGSGSANDTITMPHPGTGEVVAVMIPEPKGRELSVLLERNVSVAVVISIGTRNLQKYVSRTSVVFVSISFIVLMIISLAWLIFYYIQRFRYANARDRNQRRLGDAAKKAISKLQVRTLRRGDRETEPDFDNCAVCIEGYKANDVVRILPCRHLFHKSCVDPWLLDHRTCPMCKTNILKALGLTLNADCLEDLPLDYDLALGGVGDVAGVGGVMMGGGSSESSEASVGAESVTQGVEPGMRRLELPQDFHQESEMLRESPVTVTTNTHTDAEAVGGDSSMASLVIAVETSLSDDEVIMETSQRHRTGLNPV